MNRLLLERLGWIIFGPLSTAAPAVSDSPACNNLHICACCERKDAELHNTVKAYFSLDSLGVARFTKPLLSKNDDRAVRLLESSTQVKGRRYETGLLWRYDNAQLPDSKPMAMKRLVCLENRMQREPELPRILKEKINLYQRNGYIEKLTKTQLLRVAVTGDIREMFHQVLVNRTDQQCQRFLWRDGDQSRSPDVYAMKVMTFGATCSPSCAQFVKNHNALRYQSRFPRAAEAILKEHYVDDMLSSEESEEAAVKLAKDVRFIHSQAGLEIRNWLSNSKRVLQELEAKSGEKSLNLSSELGTEKVLGMWWCTASDTFTFKVSPRISADLLQGRVIPTKRQILSTLMMVYDPLGLLANFLMFLKILLQEIWRSGVNWDEHIASEQWEKWQMWLRVLPHVEDVRVPSYIYSSMRLKTDGFAAVAYLRFEEHDTIECAIIGAKTRVAPLRYVSIPRLELQAAVNGAHLANDVMKSHTLKPTQRFFWTDSRDVLCWINSDHRKYSQFVAVRVSEMLELTEPTEWNWIPSKLNVADDATKWQRLPDLSPISRWLRGPEYLWDQRVEWPVTALNHGHTVEEIRPNVLHHVEERTLFRWEKFSQWKRLLRQVAFVKRFPANVRRKKAKQNIVTGVLTQKELKEAEIFIIKLVQNAVFAPEIESLHKPNKVPWKKALPKSSPLYRLSPFISEDGILRMKGRIDACEFVDERIKHPVLLPKRHPVTDLIIAEIHKRYCHINQQTVLSQIQHSCILAIRNFIARRGTPLEIVSDRGTNFVGASRELKQELEKLNQEKSMEYFVTSDTKWTFNPPASPHFGGAWERLVQSVKKTLKHLQISRTPTDELLRNMMAENELIVNSRPLTELPLDDETSSPLTPNHFLLGSSDGSKPPIAFDDKCHALKHTWKKSQIYANRFWKRWIAEYLPTLTRRTKWFQPVKPIAEGDIVIVVDETLPRNCWPKGRVVNAIRSKDGQVRRTQVQTANGILERPAVKLAVLDLSATVSTSDP
ncbi:uncharacterized protein LOC129720178 [Wyeomyia smithii]|uniref:uncharacterized protein LOC129720178 n=1 Tax=Wyeomyia smithii TaxID=174621 RepID=UPI002467F600|nr:uncharacterized protein LOC129720178 [Wyeomyia smithii]